MLPENYDPKDITIKVTDDDDLGFMELYVVTCKKCHMSETGFMKYFVTKYGALLPEDPKLADIMDNWDKIIAKHSEEMKHLDVLGCILPHQTHIFASPNERKFITRPVEHANSKCHKWTSVTPKLSPTPLEPLIINVDTEPSSSSSSYSMTSPSLASPESPTSTRKRSSPLVSPTSSKKQKLLTVSLDGTVTVEKTVKVTNTKTSTDATITIKNNKRLTFKPINQLLDPTVPVFQGPVSSAEKHAQNSCYSFVLSGCSKEVSNNTTIEFYDKHIEHLRNFHQEHLGHIQVDNKALPKPVQAQLNRKNIQYVHVALVESYKHLTISAVNKTLYKAFLSDCNFSIFTDGIQKFDLELNGAYARTADDELQITNAPVSLHSIKGGSMDRHKLAVDLMNVINEIKPVSGESAFSHFIKDPALGDCPEGMVVPPNFLQEMH